MAKIFNFTRFALRDMLITAGPAILLTVLLCALAYVLVDPSPPRKVVLSTGQEGSGYDELARRYQRALARQGIEVVLRRSQGPEENLQQLRDPKSGVDIAFVQSGAAREATRGAPLVSLGSLFTEPVWLFYRDRTQPPPAAMLPSGMAKKVNDPKQQSRVSGALDKSGELTKLTDFKGKRINVGTQGSGVPQLFGKILDANGLEATDLNLEHLENTPATVELLEGRIDALVFSSAPAAPLIQMLLQTPGIRLFDFSQADAYSRRFPFLSHVTLPRGIVDLGRDIPSRDYQLIAPTATLVAREDLHPALIDLFVQAAARIHGRAGWFARQGEFPSPKYTEIPVAADAEKFYRNGPPLLQRYMPFWMSNFFDRMWVVIVALGALLVPLTRVLPPLYVWRVRSRVFRWYGELRTVEQAIEDVPSQELSSVGAAQLTRLDEIEERVNQVSIPLAFATELYGLRAHISFVRDRLQGRIANNEIPAPAAA